MAELPILYADDHLVVVDKPPRLLVVPAPGRRGPTARDLVARQLGAPVHPVHRLDEDTTGVLVLARTAEARDALEQLFRAHEIERVYAALVSHAPSPPAGRIESRLRETAAGIVESVRRGPGARAVTHYRSVRRVGRFTLVECRPETGRRNQIRVHMADIGAPIVGDRKYGFRGASPFGRVMLHARAILLTHPFTGRALAVESAPAEAELRPRSGK